MLVKTRLNSIEVLISKILIDSYMKSKKFKNPTAAKTKRGKQMLLSKYTECDSEKSRSIKEEECSGLILRPN